MNRRNAIRYSAWFAGLGLLTPGVLASLQSCQESNPGETWIPLRLNEAQVDQLIKLSDIILPATRTPSASDVKVHQFVDLLMADVLSGEQVTSIQDGLAALDEISRNETQTSFEKMSSEDATDLVSRIDGEAFRDDPSGDLDTGFLENYRYLKALILMTYFTSEQGVRQNLNYVVIPGEYKACIDLPEDGRVMVGDHM